MARYDFTAMESSLMGGQSPSPDVLFELGMMYSTGRDVELDLIEAHKWFNLAAIQGNRKARAYREEIAEEMTQAELRLAQKQAREWLRASRQLS